MRRRACAWRLAAALAIVAAAVPTPEAAAQGTRVGEVEFVRGAGAAQRDGAEPRVLGQGAPIEQGEVVSTTGNSVAIIKLNDGSRMTLRPNTRIRVDDFVFEQPGQSDNLVLNLLRGGLRMVTGAISKRTSTSRLSTPTATVGIRGTDFDARLCADDCREEARRPTVPLAQANVNALVPTAARVVALQGTLTAVGSNGERRVVQNGGPTYVGDTLETPAGSHAVLAFRDDTRITVQAGTRFRIDDFTFDARRPEDGSVGFNLLKGGIRALTGLIAKARPAAVRFSTPTATVGIRGTGIDMTCEGTCAGEPPAAAQGGGQGGTGQAGGQDGFYIFTWLGEVQVSSNASPTEILIVAAGSAARFASGDVRPLIIRDLPPPMNNNPAPRPDQINIDLGRLFGGVVKDDGDPGLYLYLRDGHLSLASGGNTIDIGRGEAAYANLAGSLLVRLNAAPGFIQNDATPRPDRVDARGAQILNMLSLGLKVRAPLVCR
jgi:hypothetical protein